MLLKTHAALLLPAAQYAATSSYHGAVAARSAVRRHLVIPWRWRQRCDAARAARAKRPLLEPPSTQSARSRDSPVRGQRNDRRTGTCFLL